MEFIWSNSTQSTGNLVMYFMFLMLFQRDKNKHNHNDLERDIKRPCDLDKKVYKSTKLNKKKE